MFSLNKQTDYALVTIYQLKDSDNFVPLSKLIENTNMPRRFLARIAAKLVRNNILISKEGKTGGYKLTKDPHKISLYNFIKIFEKDLDFVSCYNDNSDCVCQEACHHKKFFGSKFSQLLKKQLMNLSVADTFN